MFDINSGEMVVLAGIALVVLGPDKLPGYAAQAARLVRQLRTMADGAKDQMKEHLGPEFDEVDWKSLDPRQFDPRRIVRDALLDDGTSASMREPEKPVSPGAPRAPRAADEPSAATEATSSAPVDGPPTYDVDAT